MITIFLKKTTNDKMFIIALNYWKQTIYNCTKNIHQTMCYKKFKFFVTKTIKIN